MNLLAVGERETRCALTHLSGLSVFREKERERERRLRQITVMNKSQWLFFLEQHKRTPHINLDTYNCSNALS